MVTLIQRSARELEQHWSCVIQAKSTEAILKYQAAIRLDPNGAGFHNGFGTTLSNQGKTTDAIHEFRETVRLNPQEADSHYNLDVW